MKLATFNEEAPDGPYGPLWVPNDIAEWDAIHDWERARLASMHALLKRGMKLIDVGVEHAWMSAIWAQWVGPQNMVLCEPSPQFWTNIGKTWKANSFPDPLACWPGFVGAKRVAKKATFSTGWPNWVDWDGPEAPADAYASLNHGDTGIETTTIDTLRRALKIKVDAITIDVEGAELLVLEGAEKTLLQDRPLVWCSVHPDLMERDYGIKDVQVLFDLMFQMGYGRNYLGTDHEQHHLFAPFEWEGA